MACSYTYKGKDYQTKEALQEAIKQNTSTKGVQTILLQGTQENIEQEIEIIKSNAKEYFGTTEGVFVDGNKVSIEEVTLTKPQDKFQNILQETLDRIYNIEPTPQEKDSLINRLNTFATNLGIEVQTLQDYLRDYELRGGAVDNQIEALADLMQRIIAVSNKEDVSQMSEEVAHFAIEWYKDKGIISKMLDKVDQTSTYQTEAEKYRETYKRGGITGEQLEAKVRKEVLGKILAQKIQDNFQDNPQNSAEVGIFNQLRILWNNLLEKFIITDSNKQFFSEFGALLDEIANDVIDNKTETFDPTKSKEVYYSMTNNEKILTDSVKNLIERVKNDYKAILNEDNLSQRNRRLKLDEAVGHLQDLNYLETLIALSSILTNDLNKAQRLVEEAQKKGGKISDNIEIEDIVNVMIFLKNYKNYSGELLRQLKSLEDAKLPNGQPYIVNKDRIKAVIDNVIDVGARFERIRPEIQMAVNDKTKAEIKKQLIETSPADEALIEEELDKLDTNVFDDMNKFTSYYYSLSKTGNIILSAIYTKMALVRGAVKGVMNDFRIDFNKALDTYKVSDKEIRSLFKGNFMINPFNMDKFEDDYEAAQEKIKEKYNKELETYTEELKKQVADSKEYNETKEKYLALIDKRDLELYNLELDWTEQYFTKDFYQRLMYLDYPQNTQPMSKVVRDFLRSKNIAKAKIYNKYKDANGKISFENLTSIDIKNLENIEADYKSFASDYDSMGQPKTGVAKRYAEQIKTYKKNNSDFFSEKPSPEIVREFELERERVRALGEKKYQVWLANNANIVYQENKGTQIFNANLDLDTLNHHASLVGLKPFTNNNLQNQILVREKLTEKRKQLVAPFRSATDSGEIKGNIIHDDRVLSEAIKSVQNALRDYKVEYEGESNVEIVANKDFMDKLNSFTDNQQRQEFLRMTDTRYDKTNGVYIPKLYYYQKFEKKGVLEPQVEPNFRWLAKKQNQDFSNPNFNKDLQGKTAQPSLSKKEYIDEEYFEMFGVDRNNPYGKATKNQNLFQMRQYLLDLKEQQDKKMKTYGKYFQLPSVLGDFSDAYAFEKSAKDTSKTVLSRSFFIEHGVDDDMVIEDKNQLLKERIIVPKRYQAKFKDPALRTTDPSKMYGKYVEESENYLRKNQILPEIQLLRERLKNANFKGYRNADETNTMKMLDGFLSRQMYGNIIDNTFQTEMFGKTLSFGKVLKVIFDTARTANLAFQTITPVVGAVSTYTYNNLERLSEGQVTKDSTVFVSKVLAKEYPLMAQDYTSRQTTSKLGKILEFMGVGLESDDYLGGISKSRLYRALSAGVMATYIPTSKLSAAQATLGILDAYRMIDGEFMNINNFRNLKRNKGRSQEDINKEWSEAQSKSYYTYLIETERGMVLDQARLKQDYADPSKIEQDLNRIRFNAEKYWNKIESQANPMDKGMYANNPLLMFTGMHSNWFFNFLQHRLGRKEYNLLEGRYEEGNYRTIGRLFMDSLRDPSVPMNVKLSGLYKAFAASISLGMYKKGLEGLENYEQVNLIRAGVDAWAYLGLFSLYLLANIAADEDEDDFVKQYLAFIATRALSEQGSQMLPTATSDIMAKIKEPVPATRLADYFDLVNIVTSKGGETIEDGTYEGMTRRQKAILQMTFIKNLMPLRPQDGSGFRSKNLFFRSKSMGLSNHILETIEEDEL